MPRAIAYVALSLGFSLVRVAIMLGLRLAIYRPDDQVYDAGYLPGTMVYAYRKDAITFLVIVVWAILWRRGEQRLSVVVPPQDVAADRSEPRFLVPGKDGESLVRASEIYWVQVQGKLSGDPARPGARRRSVTAPFDGPASKRLPRRIRHVGLVAKDVNCNSRIHHIREFLYFRMEIRCYKTISRLSEPAPRPGSFGQAQLLME